MLNIPINSTAFTAPCPLNRLFPTQGKPCKAGRAVCRRPRRAQVPASNRAPSYVTMDANDDATDDDDASTRNVFVDEDSRAFWDDLDVQTALGPLTEEEKDKLRDKLPNRVAEFLIRRADDASNLRTKRGEGTMLGSLLNDMPPDVTDVEDDEYSDYLYDTISGPPTFRRKGSSLFGGGDGLRDVPDTSREDAAVIDVGDDAKQGSGRVQSLFVGNVGSVDEQASRVGYTIVGLGVCFLLFKILVAIISFFVSFTFSFFAIFALSAGIFVVFFFLRF